MNDLIKVDRDSSGKQTVNARELHEFLESKQEFAHWIKGRINQYGFVEGVDFISYDNFIKRDTGGTTRKEYHICLDMAKELSMVERNEKGKQARQYFIECERQAKDITRDTPEEIMARAILLAKDTMERQDERIKALESENKTMKPKAFFADCVGESEDGCLVREMAKILAQKGIMSTGQNRLYRELRDRGYVIKQRGLDYNLPTQRSIDLKIMYISENIDINPDGTTRLDRTTRITGKGQVYFVQLFAKEMGKTPALV